MWMQPLNNEVQADILTCATISFWEELGSPQGIISCHPASPCPWHPKLIRVQLGTDHGPVLFPELQQEGHWHCPDGSGSTPQCGLVLQLFSFSPNSSIWYSPSVAPPWCLSFFCVPRTATSKLPDLVLQTVPGVSHTKLLFFSRDYCRGTTNTTSKKIHHKCSYLISTAQIILKRLIFLACAHLAPLGFPPEVSILRASNPSLWICALLFSFWVLVSNFK